MLVNRIVVVRVFVVSAILVVFCTLLSTRAYTFPITFNLRGADGAIVDDLSSGSITKDGLTATLAANIGELNKTNNGFGINTPGGGDDTDAIDGGLGVELISIRFDRLVTFDQLALSLFTPTEAAGLDIAGISTILPGTIPSIDIYDFSTDNIVSIGESVVLTFGVGNGFSFDEFTVTPVDDSDPVVAPEPATIIFFGIGLSGLGARYLRRRFRRKGELEDGK